jgi:hypothetical protein
MKLYLRFTKTKLNRIYSYKFAYSRDKFEIGLLLPEKSV